MSTESRWEKVKAYRLLFIIMGLVMALPVGAMVYEITPYKQAQDKAWEDNFNSVDKKITQMGCPQLQQIRLDSIAGKDVSQYDNHWGTIRDMYNALACGNHWSVWED